jgi:hypothetical protein
MCDAITHHIISVCVILFLSLFQASGFPAECDTDEKKGQYIVDYAAKEGIQLDPRQIVKNLGLRALARLMLNSFWGKCNGKLSTNSICFS